MQIHIRPLNRGELAGFRPYLLPDARRRLMQDSGDILALGAVAGRSSCGAVAAVIEGETATLTDLFVDEAIRRRGVGSLLLDALLEALEERNIRHISASYALEADMLTVMDRLLTSRGFSPPQAVCHTFRADMVCYHDNPILRRAFQPDYRTPEGIVSFARLPASLPGTMRWDGGLASPLSWPTNRHRASEELSVALVRDGQIPAYILCGESDDGGYVLLAANSREGAPATAFVTLLVDMINRCYYRSGDFPLYFSATTEHVQKLALRIMDGNYTQYTEHFCSRGLPSVSAD